jgi:hypothetical protein
VEDELELDDGVHPQVSGDDLSVLLEGDVPGSDDSAHEEHPGEVELVVFLLDQAHQVPALEGELVLKETVQSAVLTYLVSEDLLWGGTQHSWRVVIHNEVNVYDLDCALIAVVKACIAYSQVDIYKQVMSI